MTNRCSLFHVHNRMYLVLFEGKYAERMAKQALNKQHILISISTYLNETGFPTEKSFVPSSLIEIYQFDDLVKLFERRYEDRMLIFCAGTNAISQARVVFLIGCHLIMSRRFLRTRSIDHSKEWSASRVTTAGKKHALWIAG